MIRCALVIREFTQNCGFVDCLHYALQRKEVRTDGMFFYCVSDTK